MSDLKWSVEWMMRLVYHYDENNCFSTKDR